MLKSHSSSAVDGAMGPPRTLRKIDFAKLVNLSPGRVSQMVAQGLPVEPDGRIDVARGKIWMQENIDPRRSAAQPQGLFSFERETPVDQRSRLAKEQADNMALKNAALRRELVPAAEVEREWTGVQRKVRSRVLAVPSRLRQALPHLTAADIAALDAELREALEDLADDR